MVIGKVFLMERAMISTMMQRVLSMSICATLLMLGLPVEPARAFQDQSSAPQQAAPQDSSQAPQDSSQDSSQAQPGPNAAPLSSDQLDALVAPIALYPDNLVAQVLAAATFPDQVAIADYWVQQNKSLTGSALGTAVDQQTWDDSVKALVQFPDVLDNMAKNLAWTSSLGQAFHDQQADVMTAVQVMRQKAQAAGTLKSTPQIQVTQPAPQTIVIQPANPQVVYVPQYNPAVVYGTPYVVPYYTPPPIAYVGAGLSFGLGIGIGIGIGGGFGCFGCGHPWGWGGWGVGWGGGWGGGGGGTVIFNHNTYISNRSWHSGYYNNYHPWGPGPHGGPNGPHPYHPNGFQPNGGRNGDHGLIGGRGGVQHQPDGGRNGDHGLIGGRGGVEHGPDGGRNGDHGLIGGNGGVQHNPRARMSGDGGNARNESNRGRSSMNHGGGGMRRPAQQHRAPAQHSAPHRSGGGGRRR
jgi:Protein of unknown function (DUF3300)